MSTIKVTPEQLHHVAHQVDQARQQLEHIQDNLSRQIMFLQAMWMGVTQERFYDDFARSRPVLQKALEGMVYTSQELQNIATRFENADAEKSSLGSVTGTLGAAAMMKSSESDAGSEGKGYEMKKVNLYGRLVWLPVNENGDLDYTAMQVYGKDQGNVNIDRMQVGHGEEPEKDIFDMQVRALENRTHPFTGEPVSDKYAQIMLTSLKFSQILMAFQMVRGSMPGRKGPFHLPSSDPAAAKMKKSLEAAESRGTSSVKGTGNVRTFISTDKYVAETANAIEARYPGKVVDVNKKVYRADGTPLTDYDIELDNAIIQVKQGGGKGATRQAINTASSTNKEVIVYLPNQISNSAVVKGLQKEAFQVFTSETDLINYVGR